MDMISNLLTGGAIQEADIMAVMERFLHQEQGEIQNDEAIRDEAQRRIDQRKVTLDRISSFLLQARSTPTERRARKYLGKYEGFLEEVREFTITYPRFFKMKEFKVWYMERHGFTPDNEKNVRNRIYRAVKEGGLVSAKFDNNIHKSFFGLPEWVTKRDGHFVFLDGRKPDVALLIGVKPNSKPTWDGIKEEVSA
jgi:hypothetical protein